LIVCILAQNCISGCKTGVLEGGKVEDAEPDVDCYAEFCSTRLGSDLCSRGHVRNFFVNETESLGPAVAR
ncbi:unnamed protein product, partial [Discosporangium mesarthrocarpum]